ncbi:uncharacterized protein LOC135834137 [Planococcus citri]|uniref:uncharacterized protein LOC135834137 n=1 Tax=Planococcus citri TaxID=170843 RepID=UPI0031F9FDE5
MDRKLRLVKLNINRLTNEMGNIAQGTIDLEKLNEKDEGYKALETAQMKEQQTASDIMHKYEAKLVVFRQQLDLEKANESLLDPNRPFPRHEQSCMPKLEKIKVPTVDGDILSFASFKGMFENLIHDNPELSNVQKLHYLKESCKGRAFELIKNFPLKGEAYVQAWECIKDRFDNRRVIIKTLFDKLYLLEEIRKDTELQSLVDSADVIVRGLEADRSNAVPESKPGVTGVPKKSFISTGNSCMFCEKPHKLSECRSFAGKKHDEKYELVKSKALCIN